MSRPEGPHSNMTYLDHAATSWPKPAPVVDSVARALVELGGNPGRGAHALALSTSRAVFEARRTCSELLGVADSRSLLFQPSCTVACNVMLKGTLRRGDRVVVGSMEHNAVVRPLARLKAEGLKVEIVRADSAGLIDPADVERVVRSGPTRALICQHASNVTGTIQPLGDLADIAHENGAILLVDGAQAAGHLSVDIDSIRPDGYAASGHKGMLGPPGIGLLYLSPELEVAELIQGGTGGGSSASSEMPSHRPDRYEAGSGNTPGMTGLGAAAGLLAEKGDSFREHSSDLMRQLHEGVLDIAGFRVLGPPPEEPRVPLLSIVHKTIEPDRIAFLLDRDYSVAARAGLHCAAWAHESVGSLAGGAVRLSVGWTTQAKDVDRALCALREIVS